MMETIRRFRTTLENCKHDFQGKHSSFIYLSGDTEMSKRDKDTRKKRDEDEDEDEQKKLKREKGLIDHKINQGCPRWFSLKALFALLSCDAAAAAVAAVVAAAR